MPTALAVLAAVATAGCGGKSTGTASPRPLESYYPLAKLDRATLCRALKKRYSNLVQVDDEPMLRRKVMVSDMHLGPGLVGGKFEGLEDFFFEAQWARFLEAQSSVGPTDLVIVGDFIDFWQILGGLGLLPEKDSPVHTKASGLLGSNSAAALAGLDIAIAAHRPVFRALSKFVNNGDNRVILIAGNHDAELLWPKVQLRIAKTIAPKDPSRLVFGTAAAYQHGGVHIEHGHRFDGANAKRAVLAPFTVDTRGECRLQSTWGEVFVASYFNKLEQQYPFVDNLYPEAAALAWGVSDEPNRIRSASAAIGFLDMLINAESLEFNASALRAMVLSLLGSPSGNGSETDMLDSLWEALPNRDRTWAALERLLTDPRFANLRNSLMTAAERIPDVGGVLDALSKIELSDLSQLRDLLLDDSLTAAALRVVRRHHGISVVAFGHVHLPGGTVERLEGSKERYYVNTGVWLPVQKVEDLKKRGLKWSDLAVDNRDQFPARFPAVVVEYIGTTPSRPVITYAR